MSVMPAPGLGDAVSDGLLADRQHDDDGRRDGADDLGEDVEDAFERRQALVEDDPDGHGRIEVASRDVAEREDRSQQPEPERERHDQDVRRRRRGGMLDAGDRHVADHHEHECAEQFREVFRGRSWSLRLRPWAFGRLHDSERGPRRANQQRIAPGAAQDLDELEPVDRVVGIAPTATAPWRSSRTAGASGSGGLGSRAPPRCGRPARRCPGSRATGTAGGAAAAPSRAGPPDRAPRRPGSAPSPRGGGRGRPRRYRDGPRRRRGGSPGPRSARGRCARRPRDPGGRARRRRGRRPPARPCAGRSASPAAGPRRAGPRGCPRPAEIRPRAPSRRPARMIRSVASASGPRPILRAAPAAIAIRGAAVRRRPTALSTIGRCPQSRPPSRSPSRSPRSA